jgi:RNA polymerase sigma factor (sigma-70 family)
LAEVGRPDDENPEVLADSAPLTHLLGQALCGDTEAGQLLMTLLSTDHYQTIIGRLKGMGTGANTHTVEDVFQDTIMDLMGKLEAGELKDLPEERRKDALKYFQGLCNGKLRDVVRARKSPALQRRKAQIPEKFADPKARIPGEQRDTEHFALLDEAIGRLDPEQAQVIKMYREGIPYEEMARRTGKLEETLRNIVARLKTGMLMDVISRSETAAFNYERLQKESRRKASRKEIEAAVAKLPAISKDAFMFVHYEGHTVEELAARLGDDDPHRAQARLEDAYRLLNQQFNDLFPDAYERSLRGT